MIFDICIYIYIPTYTRFFKVTSFGPISVLSWHFCALHLENQSRSLGGSWYMYMIYIVYIYIAKSSCNQLFSNTQLVLGWWGMMGGNQEAQNVSLSICLLKLPLAWCRSNVAMAVVISDDEGIDEDCPPWFMIKLLSDGTEPHPWNSKSCTFRTWNCPPLSSTIWR